MTAVCTTCNRVHEGDYRPRHPFTSLGDPVNLDNPSVEPGIVSSSMPFDPVLRQALIDKGVLTPEDLVLAEQKIRAVTNVFTSQVPAC